MMYNYSDKFAKIAQEINNPYALSLYVAKLCRSLCTEYSVLLESEAISWIVSGVKPDILSQPHRNISEIPMENIQTTINDAIEYVNDFTVQQNVIASIRYSISNHHLIYVYNDIYDANVKARIRILVRMVWYQLKKEHLI